MRRIPTPAEVEQAKVFLRNRGVRASRSFAREFAQAAIAMKLTFDQLFVQSQEAA